MKIPCQLQRSEIGVQMTPMIDVVFQLLIFFLLTGHLIRQEAQLPLPLPVAESGRENVESSAPRVTVTVFAQGEMLLQGRAVSAEELMRRLEHERRSSGDELEVRIRADRSVPYALVAPALGACAQSGVWNVSFAVYRQEDLR